MINASSAMVAARMERSVPEQQLLIPRPEGNSWENLCVSDAVIVNGVQDLGLTPFKDFVPRSAPQIGSSLILHSEAEVCQFPDITRRTLSALKNQVRTERGKARVLLEKSVEKEEEAERSQREEERLGSQADELDKAVVNMEWQESRLERKIADLEKNHADHLLMISSVLESIDAYKVDYMRHQNQVARLMQERRREQDQRSWTAQRKGL